MVKPQFILSTGTGWSATTPLWYTLQVDNPFLHVGMKKDPGYLDMLRRTPEERMITDRKNFRINGRSWTTKNRQWSKIVLQMNKELFEEGAIQTRGGALTEARRHLYFTQEDVDEFSETPLSFEKYLSYYRKHWKYLQENNCPYKAVADFSNSNANLPDWYIDEFMPKLQEHFDVKVLMIVRDPIRRLWSEVNSDDQEHFFMRKIQSGDYWNYIDIIEKWERVCPIHVIIMEQLWEGDQQERERQRLSDFLDYDIKKIHENAYCPDRGPDAPHLVGLPDQWTSDKYMLQDELYEKVRPLFPVYQQWVDKYGSLPLYWGKPYNYEV
jgi:hypothetical protein